VGGAEEDYFDFGGGDFNVWHTTIIVVIEICGLGGTYFWSLLSYYCVELRRYMKRDNGTLSSSNQPFNIKVNQLLTPEIICIALR
jgi:hypothetical protein